jgi:hypothetical protein
MVLFRIGNLFTGNAVIFIKPLAQIHVATALAAERAPWVIVPFGIFITNRAFNLHSIFSLIYPWIEISSAGVASWFCNIRVKNIPGAVLLLNHLIIHKDPPE